jgi:hypothetical protein
MKLRESDIYISIKRAGLVASGGVQQPTAEPQNIEPQNFDGRYRSRSPSACAACARPMRRVAPDLFKNIMIEFLTSTFVIRYSIFDIRFYAEAQNLLYETSQGRSLFFEQTGRFGGQRRG